MYADLGVAEAKVQEVLIGKIVGARIRRPYDVPGMRGVEASRRW